MLDRFRTSRLRPIYYYLPILIAFVSTGARLESQPKTSLLNHRLRWDDCTNPRIPISETYPVACLNVTLGAEVLLAEPSIAQSFSASKSRGYLGLHFSDLIAVHLEAQSIKLALRSTSRDDPTSDKDITRIISSFVQIGNPADDALRFSFGQQDLPFGMNFRTLPDIYEHTVASTSYWIFPKFVSKITYDNLEHFQAEFGYGSERLAILSGATSETDATPTQPDAIAIRLHHDFTALEGSRLSAFWYGDALQRRRFGAAYINADPTDQKTVIEWQRATQSYPLPQQSWQQIWRFTYTGAFRNQMRWLFEFEDERNTHRITTIGSDVQLPDYGLFRLSASSLSSSKEASPSYWFITSGVELTL